MLKRIILILLGVLILSQSVLATGLKIKFTQDAIRDKDGNVLSPLTDYHDGTAAGGPKLQLYKGSLPSPITVGSPLDAADSVAYSAISDGSYKHLYVCDGSGFNGNAVYVRVWKGGVCPLVASPGVYYGTTSDNASSGTATPNSKEISSLKTEYQCDKPYAPSIGAISESLQRVGNDLQAELVVNITSGTGTTGLREVTNYYLHVKYPSGTTATFDLGAGKQKTLSNTETGHYVFSASAKNWWGTADGAEKPYDTLGGGAAATEIVTIPLKKKSGSFGINDFGIPFATVYNRSGAQIANLKSLIAAINATGEGYVSTLGYWDESGQKEIGFTLDASGNVLNKVNTTKNPEEISIVRVKGYQVSVTGDKQLIIRNY
ncbi:MAG: hypothetical protein PHH60_01800 [Candidatus Margulisbacteria bacterium]|nr:hypothetical protein [Candidatus Margulisiibacteriota bacterium]